MWMKCFAGDTTIDGDELETIADRFIEHANAEHDWPYPEESLRNYARNFAEATTRLTGGTERLPSIGEVTIHPVTEGRIDDWIRFFDRDAFAGNPSWASCYCLEPHVPAPDEDPERPWGEVRSAGDRGADWVEGYPHDDPESNDAGLFRGPRRLYDERGFEPVEQRDRYTVVRRPALI